MKHLAIFGVALAALVSSSCNATAAFDSADSGGDAPWPATGRGPTPYSAEQIRDAYPSGTVSRMRIATESESDGVVVQVTQFVGSDAVGTTIREFFERDGERVSTVSNQRVSWVQLREHARFDAATTTRSVAAVTVPAGSYQCLLFEWRDPAHQDLVLRLYFAHGLAGPPVKMVVEEAVVQHAFCNSTVNA